MRIAVISRVFSKAGGGAESYSVALVEQLANRHEIHVFAQESNRPVVGITYHRVACLSQRPRWLNQLLFATVTWWQTRLGFDVVHSHENTWHGQIQTIHVRPLRLNLLGSRHGVGLALRWVKIALSPRLLTYLWLEGSRFQHQPLRHLVAASDGLRCECEQAYPASRPMLTVITPGAHPVLQHLTREAARSQLQLPLGAPLLLFVANDYARKGLDALLQALSKLASDVQLAVVGHPTQIPRYRKQAEQLGLTGRVYFLGSLSELAPVYCAADCLAHPTLEDSFGMVVLEAMAHGLPVVVSGPQHCGITSQLQDGCQALFLADPCDADELAERLRSVLDQPALAAKLRVHALAFAQAHTWQSVALQYDALYQQASSP
jgi:UDP-glucose:(heptosyl)LPS alpha-1,3-glucosyltransferase